MVAIVLYGDVNENGKCHIDIQEHITKYMLDRVTKASLCLTTNRINTHTWGSPASWFAGQVQSLSSLGFIPDGDSGVFLRTNCSSQYITRLFYHFNFWICFRLWLQIFHEFLDHFLIQLLLLAGITSYSVRYWHLQIIPSSNIDIFHP